MRLQYVECWTTHQVFSQPLCCFFFFSLSQPFIFSLFYFIYFFRFALSRGNIIGYVCVKKHGKQWTDMFNISPFGRECACSIQHFKADNINGTQWLVLCVVSVFFFIVFYLFLFYFFLSFIFHFVSTDSIHAFDILYNWNRTSTKSMVCVIEAHSCVSSFWNAVWPEVT